MKRRGGGIKNRRQEAGEQNKNKKESPASLRHISMNNRSDCMDTVGSNVYLFRRYLYYHCYHRSVYLNVPFILFLGCVQLL